MTNTERGPEIERVPSGIQGLDTILRGGFLRGGVYIIQGVPGAGKTIFANQICFNHVASQGGCALYVTLLAESHTRMLQHLRTMAFFDEAAVPQSILYTSGFPALEEDGLKGLLHLLRRDMVGHKATLLVLDGFVAAEESAQTQREFKKFVHEIQSHAAANNCTVLLLTTGETQTVKPEHTMVDGLIELDDSLFHVRTERSLQVRKFRGSGFLRGRHPFRITGDGVVVFPRIEAAFAAPSSPAEPPPGRLSIGIEGLDRMLHGGLPAASTTAVLGPTGTGKTSAGLHFLSLSSAAEPGLLFGFYEVPARLRAKAAALGFDLAGLEERGAVEIIWQAMAENVVDELGHRLLDAVRRRRVKRLFIDGLGGFVEAAVYPDRIARYSAVLMNELRALGVTTIYTMEMRNVIGADMEMPIQGLSSLVENVIVTRYVEKDAQVRRLVTITKMRDSDFDAMLREFRITGHGIEVAAPFKGAEAILSGFAREPKAVAPNRRTPEQTNPGEDST